MRSAARAHSPSSGAIWRSSCCEAAKPIGGSRAERYLVETRGIVLDDLPADLERVVRYHPTAPFGQADAHLFARFVPRH